VSVKDNDVLVMSQCVDVHAVCVDLTDWHKTQSAVKSLGHIDLLINNAGVSKPLPFTDVAVDTFDWQVAAFLVA